MATSGDFRWPSAGTFTWPRTGDIRVLDFDHRDGVDKHDEVSRMVLAAMSWRSIALEIAKCDVRCANCHRRRTIASKGWWRQKYFAQAEAQLAAESVARLATLFPVSG